MSDEGPKLDYADPELPRPGVPPDGYLGFRSDVPPEGVRVGCVGWIIIGLATLAIVWGLLWMLGRELKSRGV